MGIRRAVTWSIVLLRPWRHRGSFVLVGSKRRNWARGDVFNRARHCMCFFIAEWSIQIFLPAVFKGYLLLVKIDLENWGKATLSYAETSVWSSVLQKHFCINYILPWLMALGILSDYSSKSSGKSPSFFFMMLYTSYTKESCVKCEVATSLLIWALSTIW